MKEINRGAMTPEEYLQRRARRAEIIEFCIAACIVGALLIIVWRLS